MKHCIYNLSSVNIITSFVDWLIFAESLDDKMEWMKTFERVRDIERQLVWPSITELDSKVLIPEVSYLFLFSHTGEMLVEKDKIANLEVEGIYTAMSMFD